MTKMYAPEDALSSAVDDTTYTPDENGEITVTTTSHVDHLLQHGYTLGKPAAVARSKPADFINAKDDEDERLKAIADEGKEDPNPGDGDDFLYKMNRADLMDYIEERGGEIVGKPTKTDLQEQAVGLFNASKAPTE